MSWKTFSNPFKKTTCDSCGASYDPEALSCPECGEPSQRSAQFSIAKKDDFYYSPARQIGLFLLCIIGLTLVSTIVSLFASGRGMDNVTYNTVVNVVSYFVIFAAVIAVLWPQLKGMLRSFLDPKIFYGLLGLLAILLLNYLYNLAISGISHSENINQSTITAMVKSYPALSLIVFSFIGPFVEECGYRIGLFGFFRRINIVLAYVVAGVLFGLIHIQDWSSANEWLSYPPYVISGLVMGFLYDKVGFSAAYLCHVSNNLLSIISIIVTGGKS